jgi:hypothetical protein
MYIHVLPFSARPHVQTPPNGFLNVANNLAESFSHPRDLQCYEIPLLTAAAASFVLYFNAGMLQKG